MMTDAEFLEWNKNNWNTIASDKREEVLRHLRVPLFWGPTTPDQIRTAMQGSSFHLSGGMQIRNRCRDIMKDDELPPIQYPEGESRNWDDYYVGALHELLDRWDELV